MSPPVERSSTTVSFTAMLHVPDLFNDRGSPPSNTPTSNATVAYGSGRGQANRRYRKGARSRRLPYCSTFPSSPSTRHPSPITYSTFPRPVPQTRNHSPPRCVASHVCRDQPLVALRITGVRPIGPRLLFSIEHQTALIDRIPMAGCFSISRWGLHEDC